MLPVRNEKKKTNRRSPFKVMFDEVTSIVEASSEMETEKETGYERGK